MNFNDELLDLLLKRDLILQRVSNGLSKDIAKDYLKMIDEAISIIGKSDITLVNMNKVIKEINDNININYPNIEDSLKEVSITEANYIPNSINALVGVDIVTSKLSEPLINKIVKNSILSDGYTIKEGFEKLNENLQNTLQNQIRLGVLNGSTNQEIIKNIKPYMSDFTSNRIEAMVKTAVSTVVNNTRLDTYKENEDIFKGYQHQSVLDSRTTFVCAERDNKQWDLEYKPIGHKLPFKNPPLHYRCRSVMLPVTKSFKELGLNIDEVPIGTRSSLNGYVPANMSFTEWFDKQDKASQEKYLGKGRYELYKDGKINFSDLVSQKGQTLSIKELKGVSNVPVKPKVDIIPKKDFIAIDQRKNRTDEFLALDSWTSGEDYHIKQAYRESMIGDKTKLLDKFSPSQVKEIEDFNKIFTDYKPTKFDELSRGMYFQGESNEYYKKILNLKVGDYVEDMAPTSWSKDINVALEFAGQGEESLKGVLFRHKNGSGYDIEDLSAYKDEREVLVAPFNLKITKISKKGDIVILEVENDIYI